MCEYIIHWFIAFSWAYFLALIRVPGVMLLYCKIIPIGKSAYYFMGAIATLHYMR